MSWPLLLAIDPGTARCGVVAYSRDHEVVAAEVMCPEALLVCLRSAWWTVTDHLVIEQVGHYGTGQPAGREVFDTCVWIGRFLERWSAAQGVRGRGCEVSRLMLRGAVKVHLCGKRNATDAVVRRAILDRFPASGGGATPQVGTKAEPGPLYGVKGDAWQALGLGIAYAETVLGWPALEIVP